LVFFHELSYAFQSVLYLVDLYHTSLFMTNTFDEGEILPALVIIEVLDSTAPIQENFSHFCFLAPWDCFPFP